jgi:N-acetylglutamate synthase
MITIEHFDIESYTEVYALWRQCEGIGLSESDKEGNIARYLARNPGMSFIARENNTIVGAILAGHDGRRGYIHHLAVHPNYRRQGIGKDLVVHCLATLAKAEIDKCHIFVFHSNTQGIAFWKHLGWTLRDDIGVLSKIL